LPISARCESGIGWGPIGVFMNPSAPATTRTIVPIGVCSSCRILSGIARVDTTLMFISPCAVFTVLVETVRTALTASTAAGPPSGAYGSTMFAPLQGSYTSSTPITLTVQCSESNGKNGGLNAFVQVAAVKTGSVHVQ